MRKSLRDMYPFECSEVLLSLTSEATGAEAKFILNWGLSYA